MNPVRNLALARPLSMKRRFVSIGGREFMLDRESLSREGGDAGRWYVVRLDPKEGRMIDATVPDGTFRTMREAKEALLHKYTTEGSR